MILIILIFVLISSIFFIVVNNLNGTKKEESKKWTYIYKRRDFLMSRAEHECYDNLMLAVGENYYIFPQVHLTTIVDNRVVGQDWRGAFSHINGKSVDFVICDKAYISPKLVIELDDKTHEREDRVERDVEVERILAVANLPLLRLQNHGSFNPSELAQKIKEVLK